jgi:hypothetical protein
MTTNPGSWSSGGTVQVPTVTHNTYDGADRLLTTCVDGIPTRSLCRGTQATNPTVTNVYDNDGWLSGPSRGRLDIKGGGSRQVLRASDLERCPPVAVHKNLCAVLDVRIRLRSGTESTAA